MLIVGVLAAGMANVPAGKFLVYSGIGAAISAFGFGIPASLLGRQIVGNPLLMPLAMGCCIVGMLGGVLFMGWTAWRSKSSNMAL
ncbi:hypothetical protein EON80_33015 [bacterium]|nr:MAG: hypothetical protein EON80_33015 [bacterium]